MGTETEIKKTVAMTCENCGQTVRVDLRENQMQFEFYKHVSSCQACFKNRTSKTKQKKILGKPCPCESGRKRKNCCKFEEFDRKNKELKELRA